TTWPAWVSRGTAGRWWSMARPAIWTGSLPPAGWFMRPLPGRISPPPGTRPCPGGASNEGAALGQSGDGGDGAVWCGDPELAGGASGVARPAGGRSGGDVADHGIATTAARGQVLDHGSGAGRCDCPGDGVVRVLSGSAGVHHHPGGTRLPVSPVPGGPDPVAGRIATDRTGARGGAGGGDRSVGGLSARRSDGGGRPGAGLGPGAGVGGVGGTDQSGLAGLDGVGGRL